MLVLVEGGKPEYPEKNPQSKARTNKLNRHQARTEPVTLVGGKCSHQCAIHAAP